MPRGGARKGAGRKPAPVKLITEDAKAALATDRNKVAELIDALNGKEVGPGLIDSAELQYWSELWCAPDLRIRLDTRKYLYDKRDGKPVQTINHLHDKPIEMNVNIQISEIIRKVRERKREYEKGKQ